MSVNLNTMDHLKTFTDQRGKLTLLELGAQVPFEVTRMYWIYDVPQGEERGKHANRLSYQYLVAVNGSVDIYLEDINGKRHIQLNSKSEGVLLPPGTWNELRNFSSDAVLMVLASHSYDPTTYLNTHEDFLAFIHNK